MTTVTARPSIATIAGLSVLKGIMLYGATLTFAGLYLYFIVRISAANPGAAAVEFDSTLVTAAAALAGVLGSAFALEIGTPTDAASTNQQLGRCLDDLDGGTARKIRLRVRLRQVLSLDPSSTTTASWPKTFGIWAYAIVASAVAVTYVLNQDQTPSTIKALAVAFAGYVMALLNNVYKQQ